MKLASHQYIERSTGRVCDEKLIGDRVVSLIYSSARENAPVLFNALTSARASRLLGFLNYDFALSNLTGGARFLEECGIDWSECLDDPRTFKSLRDVFERKIRYWECRPMPEDPGLVVSPADSRVLVGSFADASMLCLKGKFFDYEELLGTEKSEWIEAFRGGDFAVFRLTPDKYHYNHTPVAGVALDCYELTGAFHSCNPGAVIEMATPYSKNKRVVTVIDTDVPGGAGIGRVAMIEVVALMIGDIVQCYSEEKYAEPKVVQPGMFLKKGRPKSLYRPGSSTDVLLFERGRVRFCNDLIRNMRAPHAKSRFAQGFGKSLVETDVKVRSVIGEAVNG